MGEYENVTLDMVYHEVKELRKEISMLEYAVIPVAKLSSKELQEHKRDLEEALTGERINIRDLKKG